MINIIEEKFNEARDAVQEQSNRIASELNSNVDGTNSQMARFNSTMTTVAQMRHKADELEATAIRDLNSAFTNSQAVQLGIVQQIADGQMVTGSNTPIIPTRKPKLVKAANGQEYES